KAIAQRERDEAIVARERLARVEYARFMQLADSSWREHHSSMTRRILDNTRADLRGWEWHYLNPLCQSRYLFELRGRHNRVRFASFSPDDTRIVSTSYPSTQRQGSLPGSVQVWDAETGKELFTLSDNVPGLRRACFSPKDGGRILTVQWGAVTVWDVATRKELVSLRPQRDLRFTHAAFSPDGKRIATKWRNETLDGTDGRDSISVWNAETGQHIRSMSRSIHAMGDVCFSPDGKWLNSREILVEKKDGSEAWYVAKLWDAETGAELLSLSRRKADVGLIPFSPDGSRIVAGDSGGTAIVWRAKGGSERPVLDGDPVFLRGHTDWLVSAGFCAQGTQVVTARKDGTARIWDSATGAELRVLTGHTDSVMSAAFSHNGTRVVTTSDDGTAKVWDARAGNAAPSFRHEDKI